MKNVCDIKAGFCGFGIFIVTMTSRLQQESEEKKNKNFKE
jgi:hypothetical protein